MGKCFPDKHPWINHGKTNKKQQNSEKHIIYYYLFIYFSLVFSTLEFLDKKHVKIDQGLDFLIFYQGNRGQTVEKPQKTQEKLRKTTKIEEKRSKTEEQRKKVR